MFPLFHKAQYKGRFKKPAFLYLPHNPISAVHIESNILLHKDHRNLKKLSHSLPFIPIVMLLIIFFFNSLFSFEEEVKVLFALVHISLFEDSLGHRR